MKRLVDELHAPGSPEAFLAKAIRATPLLDPPAPLERSFAPSSSSRVRPVAAVRVAVVFGFALVAFAAAGAWVRGSGSPATETVSPPAPASLPSPASEPSATGIARASATEGAPAPSSPQAPIAAAPPPTVPPPTSLLSGPTPPSNSHLSASPKDGEDPTPVLQAIRALRQDNNPARATTLLSQYLSTHPRGLLVEDALALSIEAANARHDARSAADLGRRYLARFPAGRYRAFALQAVQAPAQ